MTIQQIRAVLLTAELGSISAAAKEMKLSQPNVSNSLRLLEEEVGFEILHRTSTGAVLTEKGETFLNHARYILDQNEKIMKIQSHGDVYRLHLGGVNYSTCVEPFLKLCKKHRDDPKADLSYFNVSVEDGIEGLVSRKLDIVVTPVLKSQITGLTRECERYGIEMTYLCDIPAVIDIRKGHPAIEEGRCENITQGSDAMKDFPYIAFRNLFEDSGATGYDDSDFIQCSYKIYVDDIDIRLRMVASTNGFAFGARSSDSLLKRYNLVTFPVPGMILKTFVLTRPEDLNRREIQDYMALLRKEMQSVML